MTIAQLVPEVPDEMAIVERYGGFAAGDPCECAPDVHRWPADENEDGDEFGRALAVGDSNGDGFQDLAVGTPHEGNIGAVYTFKGTPTGLRFWQRFSQFGMRSDNYGVSPAETNRAMDNDIGDGFGVVLAVGNFNGDCFDDLAVGISRRGRRSRRRRSGARDRRRSRRRQGPATRPAIARRGDRRRRPVRVCARHGELRR